MNEVNEIRNIVYGLTTTLGMQYPELQFRLIDLCNSIDKQLELIQAKIELANLISDDNEFEVYSFSRIIDCLTMDGIDKLEKLINKIKEMGK